MTEDKPATEVWVAMGTRIIGGKGVQAFRDPEGGVKYWTDRTKYVVGGRYELHVNRKDDGVYRVGRPEYVGSSGLLEGVEWELESESAERRLRRAAAEKRDKRDAGKLDAACRPLCELAASLRSWEDVDSLMASVRKRVYAAWDKR